MAQETFSQLIDTLVARALRSDRQADLVAFANQTLREVGASPEGKIVYYARDLVEDELTADVESQYLWTPPASFERMRTVSYQDVYDENGEIVYPEYLLPGRILKGKDYYYYRTGDQFAFKGYGGIDASIGVAYYARPRRFTYYAAGSRPATYDPDDGWTYYDLTGSGGADYTADADANTAARALVTHWRLFDYSDLICEGALAKLFKLLQDIERARTHYSMFQTQREILLTAELFESLGA